MTEEYKCKDCKWLTGKKNIRGIECMHPKNQEKWNKAKTLWMGELRKDSARYKQGSALACKKFEAKESEHMGRYIDADAFLKEYCEPYPHVYMAMSKAMADAPTIDIVRCGECAKRMTDDCPMCNECGRKAYPTADDFFCADGERREP